MFQRHPTRTLAYALAATATLALAAAPTAGAAPGEVDLAFTERANALLAGAVVKGEIRALAVQPDGRIVVAMAGRTPTSVTDDVLVARLLPDGSPDRSFDGDGIAVIDAAVDEEINAVAVQPDGRIVLAGTASPTGEDPNVIVFRLKADGGGGAVNGALDPTFDRDGAAGAGTTTAKQYGWALAIQPSGRILVAGETSDGNGGTYDAVVYGFRPGGGDGDVLNGGLDPAFDGDGKATVDTLGEDEASAMALRPDGTILLAGSTGPASRARRSGLVIQLRPDGGPGDVNGALDPAFDGDGVAGVGTGSKSRVTALAVLPDGRIAAAGHTTGGPAGTDAVFWRLRRNGGSGELNGALDRTFGGGGVAYRDAGGEENVWALGVRPDGRIVATGSSHHLTEDFATFGLLADGDADPRFGGGGSGTTVLDYEYEAVSYGLALEPGGSVLVGGYQYTDKQQPHLVRFAGEAPGPAPTPAPQPQPQPQPGGPAAPGSAASSGAKPGGVAKPGGRGETTARRATFGRATRVTAQRTGRRVRLVNRNAFGVRIRVRSGRAKAVSVALAARATRTVRLPAARGRVRVTAIDPAGTSRTVTVRRAR